MFSLHASVAQSTNWVPLIATAFAGLVVALAAQYIAHRKARERDLIKERNDSLERALDAGYQALHQANRLAVGLSYLDRTGDTNGINVRAAMVEFYGCVYAFRGRAVSYMARSGGDGVALKLVATAERFERLSQGESESTETAEVYQLMEDVIELLHEAAQANLNRMSNRDAKALTRVPRRRDLPDAEPAS